MNESFELKTKDELEKRVDYYTIFGSQDFLDQDKNPALNNDDERVLAKKISYYNNNDLVKSKTRYQIKVGPYGRIYNPIGLFSEGRSNNFSSKSGKLEWRMKEVNENVFNLYLMFLKTKNKAHLNLAERNLQ